MKRILYLLLALLFVLSACEDDNDNTYILQREDVVILPPEGGYLTEVGEVFRLYVNSVSDEGVTYQWYSGTSLICSSKNLEYIFKKAGQHTLKLTVRQGDIFFYYNVIVEVIDKSDPGNHHSPYISKVIEYRPAVGQFVNELPKYVKGDTQEDMNHKAFNAIGQNNLGMITLGGYGGYIVVGFDHTIKNVKGKRDFRILGNSFNSDHDGIEGGGAEPGIIMVSYDANRNGLADDEWFEIAGSGHRNPMEEVWFDKAMHAGNDVKLYKNYEITYHRPKAEPKDEKDFANYIQWEDNQGNNGYKSKNIYHEQSYYPLWIADEQLTFKGTCLPQNGIDESGDNSYYVCYPFRYGYADNALNTSDDSTIDIDWAVTSKGNRANLPGADFIKIYTGVNQENGWIGECSTEISGVEDLHILGEDIDSPEF